MLRLEINEETISGALDRLAASLTDLTPLMRIWGDDLVQSTQDLMQAGLSPDGTPFAPRSQTTLDRYAAEGKSYGKPLNTSGMMRGEIHFAAGSDYLEVGSNAIQAAVMQMGAAQGQFGAAVGRTRPSEKRAKSQDYFVPIPWGDIPARPFVGISEDDRTNLMLTMDTWLQTRSSGTD